MVSVDNRRLVRWFDIRYHETFTIFEKLILPELKDPRDQVAVWGRKPNGISDFITYYVRGNGRPGWEVKFGAGDEIKTICPFFDDPVNITDEEWSLFEMCHPDVVSWLGMNTLKATDIELMLKGRVMVVINSTTRYANK